MLSILKTAIITIVISFISGVLLDYYKNLAPKLECRIRRIKDSNLNSDRKSYIVSVKNISNRTIHDLNLNIQSNDNGFDVDDANITTGLKFDISNDEDCYNVSIPFLSKDDEFKVKVYSSKDATRPTLALRSPEKFKRVNKSGSSSQENVNNSESKILSKDGQVKDKKTNFIKNIFFSNKKAVVKTVTIALVIFAVVFACDKLISGLKSSDTSAPASNNTQNNDAKDTSNSNNQEKDNAKDTKDTNNSNTNSKNTSNNSENNKNNNDTNKYKNTNNDTKDSENKNVDSSKTNKDSQQNSNQTNKDSSSNNTESNNNKTGNSNADNEKKQPETTTK